MVRRKKKTERRRVSAERRVTEHRTGWSPTCFDLPEGDERTELFQPKTGNYRLDIIPFNAGDSSKFAKELVYADEGEPYFERTFWMHRKIGAEEHSYVCPRKTCGKPCPICEARAKEAEKEDGDEDTIKALTPKERQLWNVIDLNDVDKGIQIWEVSFYNFGKVLDERINNAEEDDDWRFFSDPEDGFTLRVTMSEGAMGKHHIEASAIDFKPRKEGYDPDIIDESPQLDDLLKILSYKELKKVFLSVADDEDVDDEDEDENEEDEAPKKKRRTSTKKKAPSRGAKSSASKRRAKKEEVEDEDDEWDEDEDEDEVEEKPARKSRTKSKAKTKTTRRKKPEPEEEEEEEEEDDEEWEDEDEVEVEEDDEEWDDDEEEDEEEDEDDDIPFDEDDEEEEEPVKKKPSRRRSKK